MKKEELLSRVQIVNSTLSKYHIETAIEPAETNLRAAIQGYAFRVLMIGSFSAGKSAFLNRLLDLEEDILTENQIPETTIATELVYSQQEYLEAVDNDGKHHRFQFREAMNLSPKDWRYLTYHVNSDFLKEHRNMVLVDMPGLDSNAEWHNKAISQYIRKGSAYILLVSCEDGTVTASTSAFLREITQYPQSLSCFVSKADLKPNNEIESVKQQVYYDILALYGPGVSVDTVSIDDEDFHTKAAAVIEQFDPERLFDEKMRRPFNSYVIEAVTALETYLSTRELDLSEINKRIKECEDRRKKISEDLEKEQKKIEKQYGREIVPAVLNDVENALFEQSDRLTESVQISAEAFNSAVNGILRPVLFNSTQKHIENGFDHLVEQLDLSFLSEGTDELEGTIKEALYVIKDYFEEYQEKQEEKKQQEMLMSRERKGKHRYKKEQKDKRIETYQTVAGAIAIATDFINPVIELAIVFLPSIVSVISDFSAKAKREDLKRKIESVIIPQICDILEPQIQRAVEEARNQMIDQLKARMNELISNQIVALNVAQQEKEKISTDYTSERDRIEKDIRRLNNQKI